MIADIFKKSLKDLEVTFFLEKEFVLYSEYANINRSDLLHFFIPGEEKKLRSYWKTQSAFLRFIENNVQNINDIKSYLRSLPNISNILTGKELEPYELYDIKRFIKNLRSISELFNPYKFKDIRFNRKYDRLWRLLNVGQDDNNFVISSEYSKRLFDLRSKIKEITSKIKLQRKEFLDILSCECDLPKRLTVDEFTISSDSLNLKQILNSKKTVLLDDRAGFLKFKIIHPKKLKYLSKKLDLLLRKQKKLEQNVLKKINKLVSRQKDHLLDDAILLLKWEKLFSLSLLYRKYNMITPKLKNKCIRMNKARYIPLKDYLDEIRLEYTPIDIKIKNNANLITGSNMGGKTQALKTIGFIQSLFQFGMFVPADNYESQLFENIYYYSSEEMENSKGLSSFGSEINFIIKNFNPSNKSLFLLDEFARTTNIHEGMALNNALLKSFTKTPCMLVLTSHFKLDQKNCGFFRVGGLKKKKGLTDYLLLNKDERLRALHTLMDYNLYDDRSKKISEEAIRVAEIMGLDTEIISAARKFMKK